MNEGTVPGSFDAAGIVGSDFGAVRQSCNTGSITGSSSIVGGIAVVNMGGIEDCFSCGDVFACNLGGIAGQDINRSILRCYSVGKMNALNYFGGIVGLHADGTKVSDSYYLKGTAVWNHWHYDPTPLGTALTDSQMRTLSSFAGWDFVTVWGFNRGGKYPYPQLRAFPLGS